MKEIKIFEQAMHEDNEFFRTHKLNLTLFTAYRQQKHTGNELIDFSEVVWEDDIAAISEFLKAEGITEFTISSTFSSLIQTLAEFEKHGECQLHRLLHRKAEGCTRHQNEPELSNSGTALRGCLPQ